MKTAVIVPTGRFLRCLLSLVLLFAINVSPAATTRAGVVGPLAQAYTRDEIYPRMVTLPLKFITTSTGDKLSIFVTLPANADGRPAPGPFPTILTQTAYNLGLITMQRVPGGALMGAPDPFFAKRGYALVSSDALGTGMSGGGWELLGEDEQAGYGDVIDWIHEQPWFNGKLGVAGVSYMGISALFSAERRPEDVDAVFSIVPLGDAMRGTVNTGGLFNILFLSVWMTLTEALTTQNALAMLRFPRHYSTIAAATREHEAQIENYYLPMLSAAQNGDSYLAYDSEFWRTRSPLDQAHKIKAPTIIAGALEDIFQRDGPMLYETIQKNTDARLVMYEGDHITNMIYGFSGGNKVGPALNLMLQWFDHYLMGLGSDVESIPPVTQYVRNYSSLLGYGYATTTQWPHPQATAERWYLHGDKSLSRIAPAQPEPTHQMDAGEFASWEVNRIGTGNMLFIDIVLRDSSRCSASFRQWTAGMGGFLRPVCARDSRRAESAALNFESATFTEDYYINGPMQADIWLETTAHDAVLSVRVDEVNSKTGRVSPISNGLLLASHRAVDEQRSRYLSGTMIQPFHPFTQAAELPVTPGVVFKMPVEIFQTSTLIRKGNRLRISISPSNQAQGVLNAVQQQNAEGGITTIHNSPQYPSSVVLPIVPVSALN